MIALGLPSIEDRVLAMRRAGHSLGAIAHVLHLDRITVDDTIARHGDPLVRGAVRFRII